MNDCEDLVSVIIPCYNRPDYLQNCLNSIASQTYQYIEVILVDDGSTEDLQSVLYQIDWPATFSVRYFRLETNRGQGYAREVGRLQSTGKFLNYQDSDDLFHPEKIERQVKMLQRHPEAGMSYCITLNFYAYPFDGSERIRGSHYIDKILPGVIEKRPWATGSCLWTRAATEAIGPWFDGRHREDFLYDVRAGCKDISIVFIPEILMFVRCHEGEGEYRSPSKNIYVQHIKAYHLVLDELDAFGKLDDPKCLLAMSREIFRISRKLLRYEETDIVFNILHHLSIKSRSRLKTWNLYLVSSRIIFLARHILPRQAQLYLLNMICSWSMKY